MKAFLCEDFLLSSPTAKHLYHQYAKNMPIIDFHCHISPQDIAEDKTFENITQVWLYGDHYKWRAMRSHGIEERYITGEASDFEKFKAWSEMLPHAIGNPMYHWAHLELKRYFGYDGVLHGETADQVWALCNQQLLNGLTVRKMIEQAQVEVICTTDDPIDDLKWHDQIAKDHRFKTKVLPAFRPDSLLHIQKEPYVSYIHQLSEVSGIPIRCMEDVYQALLKRLDHFEKHGCCATDHGLDQVVFAPASAQQVEEIFKQRLAGQSLNEQQVQVYQYALMSFLAKQYATRGWVMELHYGTKRSNNKKMFHLLGADSGFDCMNGVSCGPALTEFLNALEQEHQLPKTMLFSLNPHDNEMIGTVLGCFQSPPFRSKIQQGSAWWFNDTKTGMITQLISLANLSLLGNFVGMLTDSRSFLSYTRHEYFRRILCELLGGWVENGEYPNDDKILKTLIENICYHNAKEYFGF